MIPRSWIQSELLCNGLQGIADDHHVLVEGYTELLGARDELLAVYATGKGLVLHLLAHGARLDRAQRLVRLDQRAGDDEAAHLVHGVEGLPDVRIPGDVQVISMRGDVVEDVLGPPSLAQHLDPTHRVQVEGRP